MSAFNLSLASPSRSQEGTVRFQATHAHPSIQGAALQARPAYCVKQFVASLLRSLGSFAA